MEKFMVTWNETVEKSCSVVIEAKNIGVARAMFDRGEYDGETEEKEDVSSAFDESSVEVVPYDEPPFKDEDDEQDF